MMAGRIFPRHSSFARTAFCGLATVLWLETADAASPKPVNVPAQKAFTPAALLPTSPSVFEKERAMTPTQLVKRWKPIVTKAARRFGVPVTWINAVMRVESGGRTLLSDKMPMVSEKGAV